MSLKGIQVWRCVLSQALLQLLAKPFLYKSQQLMEPHLVKKKETCPCLKFVLPSPLSLSVVSTLVAQSYPFAADSDYSPLINQGLIFTSTSSQRQCINILIVDDDLAESIEQFLVQINQDANNQAVISITDNDGEVWPSIASWISYRQYLLI